MKVIEYIQVKRWGKFMNTITGFVRVMENPKSHGIYFFNFQVWKVMKKKYAFGK